MLKFKILLILFCALPILLVAQSRRISGHVTRADDGTALPGVTVKTQKNVSTQTDSKGYYTLTAQKGDVITFSFLGMNNETIVVNEQNTFDVKLGKNDINLDEVVVRVGYGTVRKSDLTGAVASIKGDELTKLSSVDVTQALQGKTAGVSVINNSGEPGSGTKIRIRGTGSVNNSSPLYVVDEFPVSDISHVAPQDIESIEVLKDASAVAIYGSRGANGVILVRTKNGKYGSQTKVSVNVFGGISEASKKLDLLNAAEYAELKLESFKNANQTPSVAMKSILDYAIANRSIGTNWQDEILRTGNTQNYNINVSGGSEKNKFDIGGTYSRETGLVKNTFLNKFLLHVNNEYKLSNHVNIGINASFTTYDKSGNDGDFYSGSITQALKADPVSAAWDSYTKQFGEIYFSYGRNPALSAYENQYRKNGEDRFIANAYLQINDIAIKGLSFKSQFGQQLGYSKSKNYYPLYFITADQRRDRSNLNENRAENTYWNTSHYFNYANIFGKHSINATLGGEAYKAQSNNVYANVYDVPENTDLRYLSMSSNKVTLSASGGAGHNSLLSGFFRFNYSYDGRYLLTGTVRADGSSKFLNKWGYFPSFSAGWNILEEDFAKNLKNTTSLTQLKLRAGWGHVGNQASAGNFDYLTLMNNGYTAVFGDTQVDGAIQQKVANAELSWETSESYNLGLDFGLLQGKLTGNVDYFVRNTNDMILDTPIPIYVGKSKPKTNAGSVRNSGIEFNTNFDHKFNTDFSLNLGFNISFIQNKVTSLGGGEPLFGTYTKTEVGKEIATFYGLQSAGIFKTKEQLDAYTKNGKAIQPLAGLGDVIFVDQNNDGIIDDKDRIHLGSATPKFTYGFNLSLAYKGFDLNAFIQGSQGNKIANYMYTVLYSTSMREWSNSKDMMNRWTPQNANSDLPRVHSGDPNQNDRFSDRFVEDGSYARLRTLQLGYALPTAWTKKAQISRARIYVSADNLVTLTKYSGFNPEMGDLYGNPLNAGVDMASYPIPRVFTVGCNFNF